MLILSPLAGRTQEDMAGIFVQVLGLMKSPLLILVSLNMTFKNQDVLFGL